jgi:3',5'-cyclic AMP phosphodiesterase CpdA
MKIAHLSDLHFGRHDENVAGALVPELDRQHADLVVISGDFTQHGTESEFKVARAFIDRISSPVFAVPGNHDGPQVNVIARLLKPYALYRQYIANDLEPFAEVDGVALLGLKTPRRFTPDLNWSNGFLDRRQLARLKQRFAAAAPDSIRVVVAHHPLLYPEGDGKLVQHTVRHADRALKAFASLGVRLVLSGHFHLSYVRIHQQAGSRREGVPDGLRQAAAAPIFVAQTSSTTSTRLRGDPNAYNLIDIGQDRIEIDVREWRGDSWVTRERNEAPAVQPSELAR